jgi:cytochrome P450
MIDPTVDPLAIENMTALADAMPFPVEEMARSRNLIASDPPQHDVLRSIVNRGFTPRRISAWEPRIRELVSKFMERVRGGQGCDIIADVAVPVPVIVVSEMLGVEPERRADFKRWSDIMIEGVTGSRRREGFIKSGVVDMMRDFATYFGEIAERRRAEPRDDLVSVLVDAAAEEGGLRPMELVTFVLILLVAGNETTTNTIGHAVKLLLENPDQLERVRRDRSLVPNLVEEVLRYESPIQMLFRRARRDTEIRGQKIGENEIVCVLLGSANRDQRRWERGDEFDVGRDAQGHMAFGFGVHFCLGASLARLEARCVLDALVDELPRLRRRENPLEYVDSNLVRGLRRFELELAA